MRWLFATTPGIGHVQPLLGLALAARDHGHAVAWATGADALPEVAAHGLEAIECGERFDHCLAALRQRYPDVVALPGREHALFGFPLLFGELCAAAMVRPLRACAERWKPDLIVSEPAALAAPLVARALGLRQVTHEFGLTIPPPILQRSAEVMAEHWAAWGLQAPGDAGVYSDTVIEIAPPALRAVYPHGPPAPVRLDQRPASITAPAGVTLPRDLNDFLARQRGRPILAIGFGTLHPGGPRWALLMQAIAQVDAACVVSLGPRVPLPDALPSHVWAARYVPFGALLPHCRAMMSHGGAGSLMLALQHGIPQLTLPYGADQFRNADAARACGVARVLEGEFDAATLRAQIESVLGDQALRRSALGLASQIDAMPSPHRTVEQLSA